MAGVPIRDWRQCLLGHHKRACAHVRPQGLNANSELGDGTTANRGIPILTDAGPWALVTANDEATCALDLAGMLSCWGINGGGQLGTGSIITLNTPTKASTNITYANVALGRLAACGVPGVPATLNGVALMPPAPVMPFSADCWVSHAACVATAPGSQLDKLGCPGSLAGHKHLLPVWGLQPHGRHKLQASRQHHLCIFANIGRRQSCVRHTEHHPAAVLLGLRPRGRGQPRPGAGRLLGCLPQGCQQHRNMDCCRGGRADHMWNPIRLEPVVLGGCLRAWGGEQSTSAV